MDALKPPDSVAVLGAGGTMGAGMARNIAAAGFEVRAWNRSGEKLEPLKEVAAISRHQEATEAVRTAAVVLTMLSDADAVLAVMEEAAPAADRDVVWLQTATIGVDGINRCAELADREGITLVDAPVLGTKGPAEKGELIVLASGPERERENLAPVLDAVGKRTIWVGETGAGSRLKVAINSWIVAVVEATAETLALAEGVGVDPELVLEAIEGGPLDLPYMRLKAGAMMRRDFDPSFRLALASKDARLAVESAADAGLSLPMLEAIAARLDEAAVDHGDEDLAATYLSTVG